MTSIEFAQAWTRKLEALGIVDVAPLRGPIVPTVNNQPLHPHPRAGRKRAYQSAAQKQRAYRDRRRHVTGVMK